LVIVITQPETPAAVGAYAPVQASLSGVKPFVPRQIGGRRFHLLQRECANRKERLGGHGLIGPWLERSRHTLEIDIVVPHQISAKERIRNTATGRLKPVARLDLEESAIEQHRILVRRGTQCLVGRNRVGRIAGRQPEASRHAVRDFCLQAEAGPHTPAISIHSGVVKKAI